MSNTVIVTKRKRTLIFINIVFACVATSMLATALTTALPDMIRDFNISVTTGQWLTSGYSLAMSAASAALVLIAVFGVASRRGKTVRQEIAN